MSEKYFPFPVKGVKRTELSRVVKGEFCFVLGFKKFFFIFYFYLAKLVELENVLRPDEIPYSCDGVLRKNSWWIKYFIRGPVGSRYICCEEDMEDLTIQEFVRGRKLKRLFYTFEFKEFFENFRVNQQYSFLDYDFKDMLRNIWLVLNEVFMMFSPSQNFLSLKWIYEDMKNQQNDGSDYLFPTRSYVEKVYGFARREIHILALTQVFSCDDMEMTLAQIQPPNLSESSSGGIIVKQFVCK